MSADTCFKYLVSSSQDELWGMTVDDVGQSPISAGYERYPAASVGHPSNYDFDITKGRILDNYQLIYISRGKGWYHETVDKRVQINAGDMLIIPPYRWHSYYPDKKTGWQEYWIGIRGPHINNRYDNGFFGQKIIYGIGFHEQIIDLYKEAIGIALKEESMHQPILAAIANYILAYVIHYECNNTYEDGLVYEKIAQARSIMRENVHTDITPAKIAEMVNMSYSWFRKTFKAYTNISPAKYISQLKLQEAKSLLLNSHMSIKEIAFHLHFEDTSYFSAVFRRNEGCTPSEYRQQRASYKNEKP